MSLASSLSKKARDQVYFYKLDGSNKWKEWLVSNGRQPINLNSKDTTTESCGSTSRVLFETRKQMCDVLHVDVYEADCGNEISIKSFLFY